MTLPESMTDHWWWRPGVRPGRSLLVWHVLMDDQPELRNLVGACRERLNGCAGLDPVPDAWLHMTTQIVGFGDEIDAAQRADMLEAVRQAVGAFAPVTTDFGKVIVHPEAVVLAPLQGRALDPVWEALREAVGKTVANHHLGDDTEWWPHVTVAYSNSEGASEPIVRALTPRPEPVTFTLRRVHLVEQVRVGHLYRWDRLAAVDLAPS